MMESLKKWRKNLLKIYNKLDPQSINKFQITHSVYKSRCCIFSYIFRFSVSQKQNGKPQIAEHIIYIFVIKPTICANFSNSFLELNSTCFEQFLCPSSSWSCRLQAVNKPVWHITLLCAQWIYCWWWTEKLSETCRV